MSGGNSSLKSKEFIFRTLPLLLAFIIGAIFGLGLEKFRTGNSRAAKVYETREGRYAFINPLLECETADDTIGDRALRPFKENVRKLIDDEINDKKVVFMSVYFRDLNNGPWFGVNEGERFYPASLMKVPYVMALLKQAESDKKLLKRKIKYKGGFDFNANDIFKPAVSVQPEEFYTVEELIYMLLVYSDNNTIPLLNHFIDDKVLHEVFRDLSIDYPVNRLEDYMSVATYATFFRILFNSSYLNREMSERALRYLSKTTFQNGLVAGVPKNIPVAHKFGEQTITNKLYQLHDCGIVYYPNSPYLLCIMGKGENIENLATAIGNVSRAVFEGVNNSQKDF